MERKGEGNQKEQSHLRISGGLHSSVAEINSYKVSPFCWFTHNMLQEVVNLDKMQRSSEFIY